MNNSSPAFHNFFLSICTQNNFFLNVIPVDPKTMHCRDENRKLLLPDYLDADFPLILMYSSAIYNT